MIYKAEMTPDLPAGDIFRIHQLKVDTYLKREKGLMVGLHRWHRMSPFSRYR